MAEWHDVPLGSIVIVEGIYSTRNEPMSYYDLKIWNETPHLFGTPDVKSGSMRVLLPRHHAIVGIFIGKQTAPLDKPMKAQRAGDSFAHARWPQKRRRHRRW